MPSGKFSERLLDGGEEQKPLAKIKAGKGSSKGKSDVGDGGSTPSGVASGVTSGDKDSEAVSDTVLAPVADEGRVEEGSTPPSHPNAESFFAPTHLPPLTPPLHPLSTPPPPPPTLQSFVLTTNVKTGLGSSVVRNRQEEFGPNELAEKVTNPILVFLSYFWVSACCAAGWGEGGS
jgi:hypothetical protein